MNQAPNDDEDNYGFEMEEHSGVEGYIDNLKNLLNSGNSYQYLSIAIIKSKGYDVELDTDFERYIDSFDDDFFTKDKKLDDFSRAEIFELIRKDFLDSRLDELMDSVHEWAFNADGTMSQKLTSDQALTIAKDYPLSTFLMDSVNIESITKESEIFARLIVEDSVSLNFAAESLKSKKEFVKFAVKEDPYNLSHASDDLRNNREVVLIAVSNNGYALQFASEILKNDKEVVLEAVKQYKTSIRMASKEIRLLVGDGDPVQILTRAINSENLSAKLFHDLKPDKSRKVLKIKL